MLAYILLFLLEQCTENINRKIKAHSLCKVNIISFLIPPLMLTRGWGEGKHVLEKIS